MVVIKSIEIDIQNAETTRHFHRMNAHAGLLECLDVLGFCIVPCLSFYLIGPVETMTVTSSKITRVNHFIREGQFE